MGPAQQPLDAEGCALAVEGLRRARRAFVRTAHPDRGGDPALFQVGLAELDRRLAQARGGVRPPRVTVTRRPSGPAGWARRLARRLARRRAARPRVR